MIKKLLLTGLIAGSALYANTVHYLNKKQTENFLKIMPNAKVLLKKYKAGSLKVYIQNNNKDFYLLSIKENGHIIPAFVTKDKKYLIAGRIFNLKTGNQLMGHPPINKNIIEKGIVMTMGKGTTPLYLILDPECPFCKRLHNNKSFMNKLKQKYKINVIIYPLSFHSDSLAMTEYVLSAKSNKERVERLNAIYHGSMAFKKAKYTKAQKEALHKQIEESKKAAMELNFQGTPNFFNKNFNAITPQEAIEEK